MMHIYRGRVISHGKLIVFKSIAEEVFWHRDGAIKSGASKFDATMYAAQLVRSLHFSYVEDENRVFASWICEIDSELKLSEVLAHLEELDKQSEVEHLRQLRRRGATCH